MLRNLLTTYQAVYVVSSNLLSLCSNQQHYPFSDCLVASLHMPCYGPKLV